MWITKRENGKGTRYVYRERFTNERTGKKVIVSVTLNSNSRHAQKVAADMLREKYQEKQDHGQDEKAARVAALPLAAVCDEWLRDTDMTVKVMTRRNHRRFVSKFLDGVGPDLLFTDFTPATFERVLNRFYYLDRLSYNYVKHISVTVKAIMRYAKKAGYIENVTDFEEITLKRRPATPDELARKNNKYLDHDELRSCLDQLAKINYRVSLAMEFVSLTGLRIGELLALRREDVELDKSLLHVTGTLLYTVRNGDEYQRGTPKNAYSYRTIDLNRRAVQILEWFYTDNKRQELWGRTGNSLCSKYKDRGYIFTTGTGNPYNMQFINRLLRQVSIPGKHISTHIFRHTHISMLAAMGVPVKAIMQRVGHNDPNTTLSIYTHVTAAMNEQLKNSLDKMSI